MSDKKKEFVLVISRDKIICKDLPVILWQSYGNPMAILWQSYGNPMAILNKTLT